MSDLALILQPHYTSSNFRLSIRFLSRDRPLRDGARDLQLRVDGLFLSREARLAEPPEVRWS